MKVIFLIFGIGFLPALMLLLPEDSDRLIALSAPFFSGLAALGIWRKHQYPVRIPTDIVLFHKAV